MNRPRSHPQGSLLVLCSTIMFAGYGVWSRLLGPHFPNFYQSYVRALLLCVPLCIILAWRREILRIVRSDLKWLVTFLLFSSATQAPIYYAFNHMDIGSATLLFYVSFLIAMYVVGYLFHREKVTLIKVTGFVTACAGLYVVFSFSLERFSLLAASMAVLNGIASGGEVAFSKKLSDKYSPLYLTTLSWLIIAATSLPLSLALGESQVPPALTLPWLFLICYAISSLLAFWTVILGVRYLEASIGGLIGLLEIVFSIAFGVLFFGESISGRIAIGGALILFAAALPNLADLLSRPPPRQRDVA